MSRAGVLFVDDEAAVLDGLRDLLRRDCSRYDMVFAQGGQQALAELAKRPFQVVVSDMRMPGMDGAELLGRVKEEFPRTTRIVLSGHAEREAVLRAMPVAHQFLSKPCDAAVLRIAIERTCGLQGLLANEALQATIGALTTLPSVPQAYAELVQAAADPAMGARDLAELVQRDPAMGAKVLQLANSAFFGRAPRVTSLQEALSFLGVELVKGVALTANIFATLEGRSSGSSPSTASSARRSSRRGWRSGSSPIPSSRTRPSRPGSSTTWVSSCSPSGCRRSSWRWPASRSRAGVFPTPSRRTCSA